MTEHDRPLPLIFPLHGTRLIEASAGTGKTFTLAALYLRLVLGHGGDNAFARALLPPEILVVTFTEAATEELRERIRDRLAEAARAFAGEPSADAILNTLLSDYPDADDRRGAARRLDAAAQWMDEAAIYTIHGFCNRMLKQHAFDSGSLFNLELNEDASEEQYRAACDYWRTVIARFPAAAAPALKSAGLDSPNALLAAARPLLGHAEHGDALPESVHHWQHATGPQQAVEDQARASLQAELPALRAWVAEALEQKWLSGQTYKPASVPAMFEALSRYAEGFPGTARDDLKALHNFSAGGLRLNKAGLAHRPALSCLEDLQRVLESREDNALPRSDLLKHAAAWVARRVAEMRRQSATMGFDDMLSRLRDALADPANGPRLARVIREQFPVALIDEFQDTDPVQYRIFSALYEHQPGTGWFMIGDPKQAIYAFRGADVHTYLAAREATETQHTLDRNFRSASAMVAAVNALFEHGESLSGDVFLMEGRIPFQPVSARGRDDTLCIDGQPAAGLTLWVEDNERPLSSGVYRERQAQRAAGEIARLLNGAETGSAGFRQDGSLLPLRSRDIAVLVRDRGEAAAIRTALASRNVRSVYLSDQDSVYATPEAADLLLLLHACAAPEADLRVRSALASTVLAQPYAALDALNRDERLWEAMVDRFHGYKTQWQRQGVLPMLRGLLLDFQVPERLSRSLDGERSLTNLLHLAELLQQAAGHLDGEQALIRHLQDALQQGNHSGDDTILRLESDDDRVRVITIHKSKGLEYPLVFLPFVCGFRPAEQNKPPLRYHDDGALKVDLEPDAAAALAADQERLAEDMRLLYVALTRAQHACWLGLSPYARGSGKHNQLAQSAIGRLLFGIDGVANDGLSAALAPLASDAIRVAPPPADNDHHYRPADQARPWRGAARFSGRVTEPWWIASYSALKQVEEELAPADPRGDQLAESEPPAAQPDHQSDAVGIHAFPRGPLPGTLLHDLLEQAGRDGFAATLAHPAELDRRVEETLAARHWQAHQPVIQAWWRQTLTTPFALADGHVSLQQLGVAVPEMEFLFPARHVPVAELDRLIRAHIAPGVARPRLEADTLNGMLKGFIDLVFEHQGRYYVLDYKSNWLGVDDAAYTRDTMTAAILEARYEVQYALYLLALHRLLRSRLGDEYQPEQHLGGAVYVFLRGLAGSDAGAVFERPPQALIEALDRLFVPESEAGHAA
ncbi:exodeoxyribonuclease V subunit beta [Alcanivorax sp. N3-2A]|nr:exodeoxyribonuclease V subunit beta [Alcanivorax sp. N3-2A]|tara:strand:+ start:12428 stop:16042 length:3615 start_codon:yes stop_codon:yes gene_type:complete